MAKPNRMNQMKSILRCYLATRSIKATARMLMVSKNTVREYLRRAHNSGKDLAVLLEMDEGGLIQIFSSGLKLEDTPRDTDFVQRVDYWLEQLQRPGVTRKLVWEEYRRVHPQGYGFSQFCLRLQGYIKSRDLTPALELTPV